LFELFFKYPAAQYARADLVFESGLSIAAVAGLGAAALVGIGWFLYTKRRRQGSGRIVAIGVLQAAMLACVLFMLLQPALEIEQLKPSANALALVLDRSGSMAEGLDRTRFDAALEALDAAAGTAPADLEIRRYAFGTALEENDSYTGVVPDAGATSIADALLGVLEQSRTQPLAGVVVASDGIDTGAGLSSETLAGLAAFGVPVHTIDLMQVVVPRTALPKTTVPARVSIRHDGAAPARVKVYSGDDLVQSVPVELESGISTTALNIDVPMGATGYQRLEFVVERDGEEPERRNNRREAMIKVEERRFRILYFEGEPRWEYKFLRRALGDDRDIALETLLRVSPNKYYRQGIPTPDALEDGFPASRDTLFEYDALIIGSVEVAALTLAQLDNIRDFVGERGGSLLMLAGRNGLGNGGWGQSSAADVLPVRLPPSDTESFVRQKATVALTPQGSGWAPLLLDGRGEDNTAAWAGLPEIADYQRTGALKPAARALLAVDTGTEQLPLLMTQPYGRGHSYVLATGGTWRWQMSLPHEDPRHERFWRQLLRALVSTAPPRSTLTAEPDDSGRLELRAELRDEAFDPVTDVDVTAIVSHEDGESRAVSLAPSETEPGVFKARLDAGLPGSWYVEAVARRSGEPAGTLRAAYQAQPGDREYFNLRRNGALLRRLADATGGRYFGDGDIAELPELLRYSRAGVTERVVLPIWDAAALFLVLLTLKTGEWLLRRRWRTI